MTNPARLATIVNFVLGVKSPRNCPYTRAKITTATTNNPTPASLYGGFRGALIFAGVVMAVTP